MTDADFSRTSYQENADGYVLTASLMQWFWDHYADPEDRTSPLASPLLAENLSDLPPAMVVTCEFDPLRDEGRAYAQALENAGVPVRYLNCEGQVHITLTAVDAIVTSEGARAEMAKELAGFFQ